MSNLEPQSPQSNTKNDAAPSHDDAALAYLRRELAEVAAGMTIQLEILERYTKLGDDVMALHTIRQIRPAWKMLYEIARRIHALREGTP